MWGVTGERGQVWIGVHSRVRNQLLEHVVLHTLERKSKFYRMGSNVEERVIIKLKRVPCVQELVEPTQSIRCSKSGHGDLRRRNGSGRNSQSFIGGNRAARNRCIDISDHPAITSPNGIDESTREDVGVLSAHHLPAGKDLMYRIPEGIRLLLRAGIEEVAKSQIIVDPNLLVDPGGDVILARAIRHTHIHNLNSVDFR